MTDNLTSSIIVCTKDRVQDMARFLNSLNLQSRLPDELIVVDASKDGQTKALVHSLARHAPYRMEYTEAAAGLTFQRNVGVKMSTGDILFFFDDDVVLEKDFIKAIIATFLKYEDLNVGGISGRITNLPEDRQFVDYLFRTVFFLTDRGKGCLKLSGFPSFRRDNQCASVEVLPGGCTAYKSDVFSHFAFDENLAGYAAMEDVDFSYRVSRSFRLIYQPAARLAHYETTHSTADSRKLKRMQVRNHFYLFRKNINADPLHIAGFMLSIAGLFLFSLLLSKDLKACCGIIDGLLNPLR